MRHAVPFLLSMILPLPTTMASSAHAGPAHALGPGEKPGQAITLLGRMDKGGFAPSEHELAAAPAAARAPAPLPLRANLLPLFEVRGFGVEERVSARLEAGCLRIACRAGSHTAGVLLSALLT